MQFEEYALRLNAGDFANRSKAKAKPQKRDSSSSSTRTTPIWERTWTDVEPGIQSLTDYSVSKKLIHLLRRGSQPRNNDGAIEFWRIKDNLQKHFLYCHHWSDEKWKSSMAGEGGGEKKRFQYCSDSSGIILYVQALQGHIGRSLIDSSSKDNVINSDGFFKYIHHVGCAINLNSIINSGLISGGQNLSNRQTVFFLPENPMDKEHKDPDTIDLEAPRLAQYMHKAWKKHQNTVYWVDINLALKKRIKHDRTLSFFTKRPQLVASRKLFGWKLETSCTRKYRRHLGLLQRFPLKHDWMKNLGSEVARQSEGEVARQSKKFPIKPIKPTPHHDRTVKHVVCTQRRASQFSGNQNTFFS